MTMPRHTRRDIDAYHIATILWQYELATGRRPDRLPWRATVGVSWWQRLRWLLRGW